MSAVIANPGQLKLELAIHGTRIDPSVRRRTDLFRAPWVRENVTRSVELLLPGDVWVSVPVGEKFTESSPFTLTIESDQLQLTRNGQLYDVRVVPPPAYYSQKTASGLPMWRVGTAYGGYIAVNPATACQFSPAGKACRFCDLATQGVERTEPLPVEDVIETIRAAFAEGAVEFVYLHIGYMNGDDAGVTFLEPYIRAIKRHFDTLLAVQLQPPRTNAWIDQMYAMGVDALSYSIEVYDPELLRQHCAGRDELVGRDRYYEALAYAASVLPSGTVWSDLIVGLEPPESTIAGINQLVKMGVLPVLSIFRPLDDTELRDHPVPSLSDVEPIFAHLFNTVYQARINMNWVRDLSFAITPLEARFFAGDEAKAASAMTQFYKSRLGNFAARNLSRLRRRLRVRKVSDSFDSSHL